MRATRRPSKFDSCVGGALFALLCLVFSPAMLYLGIASVQDELNLQDRGVTVNAVVTDSQVEKDSYQVRYQFRVGSSDTWYSCSDRTGRRNLWCSIAEEHWQVARSTGRVQVTYLPANPWINRPIHSTSRMFDSWAGVCTGVLPWALLLIGIISKKRDKRQRDDDRWKREEET